MDELLARSSPRMPDVGEQVTVVITGRYVHQGVTVYSLRVVGPF